LLSQVWASAGASAPSSGPPSSPLEVIHDLSPSLFILHPKHPLNAWCCPEISSADPPSCDGAAGRDDDDEDEGDDDAHWRKDARIL